MEKKGNDFLGIVGALLGGFIGAIPWILVYFYGNMLLSALAFLIAIGALKGFQLLNGKVSKKLPYIIAAVSFIVVITCNILIIPIIALVNAGLTPTFEALGLLYKDADVISAITQDLIFSIIFTVLGISGVISNIKKQIYLGETDIKINFSNNNTINEYLAIVSEAFDEYKAYSKESAVHENKILEFLDRDNGKEMLFDLKARGIVKSKKEYVWLRKKVEKNKKDTK